MTDWREKSRAARWRGAGWLLLCLLGWGGAPHAVAKLYKIVDENGNVTFSQFPPSAPGEAEGVKVEEQQVQSGGQSAVTTKGDQKYCGTIRLPTDKYYKNRINNHLEGWERQLDRLQEILDNSQKNYLETSKYRSRYGSSAGRAQVYLKQDESTVRQMRDIRCAIDWAKAEEAEPSASSDELYRLREVKKKLEAQHDRVCGAEPIYDPSKPGNREDRNQWSKCHSRFSSDLRHLDALIQGESRKNGGE